MYIYCITNKLNDKKYVGKNILSKEKTPNYFGSGKYIKRSIKKYGKENFTKNILEECITREELAEREKFWIKEINTIQPNGYNITPGGENAILFGKDNGFYHKQHSDETKKILSEKQKNRVKVRDINGNISYVQKDDKRLINDELIRFTKDKKVSNSKPYKCKSDRGGKCIVVFKIKRHFGFHFTIQELQKMSELHKGKQSYNKGKCMSDESKKKMSDARIGIKIGPMSEEHKHKISESNKGKQHWLGKHHSDETKKKMSETQKNRTPEEKIEFYIKWRTARYGEPTQEIINKMMKIYIERNKI